MRFLRTGDLVHSDLEFDPDQGRTASLEVAFGPGQFALAPAPAADAPFVRIVSRCNVDDLRPEVRSSLDHGHLDMTVGSASHALGWNFWAWDSIENHWDLSVSPDVPLQLRLALGAGEADVQLGGLPLSALDVELGAGEFTVDFDRPNPEVLEELRIEAGAAQVQVHQIGNANARRVELEFGSGAFVVDLSGEWRHDAEVSIDAGVADLDLLVPQNTDLELEVAESNLAEVDSFLPGGGSLEGERFHIYRVDAGRDRPRVRVRVEISVGALELYPADEEG